MEGRGVLHRHTPHAHEGEEGAQGGQEWTGFVGAVHIGGAKKALNGVENHQAGLQALEFFLQEWQVLQGKKLYCPVSIAPVRANMDALRIGPIGIEARAGGLGEAIFPGHQQDVLGGLCAERRLPLLLKPGQDILASSGD
jgi:hypothetical protein